jgi:spore coat polysaccharide biosynthesis protein SpsF
MTSTRLPGKVLKPLLGEPMLARQIERTVRSQRIDRLVVATSNDPSDDPIQALCEKLRVRVFRGSLDDVLGRYWGAVRMFGPTRHVVRLTGDCPLTDWEVIDAVIDHHLAEGADYTSNTEKLTFPKGLDVEVFKSGHLETAYYEARDPYEREHVTPFFYRNPDRFQVANLECNPPLGELRWTVDTPEDFEFVERVFEGLYPDNPDFLSEDIALFTENDPPRPRG